MSVGDAGPPPLPEPIASFEVAEGGVVFESRRCQDCGCFHALLGAGYARSNRGLECSPRGRCRCPRRLRKE